MAYRYFTTGKRKFIVADTPGREQDTRNMISGASTANAAVLLVDARHGLLTQTRWHAPAICSGRQMIRRRSKTAQNKNSARVLPEPLLPVQGPTPPVGLGVARRPVAN